jgi:PBP1b-binding outer membrane lipoprotein LpoB
MPGRICSLALIALLASLCGCSSIGTGPKSSSSQTFGDSAKVARTSGTEVHPSPLSSATNEPGFRGLSLANFYERIVGGQVVEATKDQIVVEAKASKPASDPVALTNDAIITTSVRARIAREAKLRNKDFQVTSNDGVVSIRAQQDSLDDALAVINLTLGVTDVREIVYILPTRV